MGYAQRVRQAAHKVTLSTKASGFIDENRHELADKLSDELQDPLALVGDNDRDRNISQHASTEDALFSLMKQAKAGFAKSGDLASFAMKIKAAGDAAGLNNPDAKVACDLLVGWLLDLDAMPLPSSAGVGSAATSATRRGVTTSLKRLGHVVLGGTDPDHAAGKSLDKAWDASFDAARLQMDAKRDVEDRLSKWSGSASIPNILEAFRAANLPISDADLPGLAKAWLLRDVAKKATAGNVMVESALKAHDNNPNTAPERIQHMSRGIMRSGQDDQAMSEAATQVDKMADLVTAGDLKGARSVAEVVKRAMKHRGADALRQPITAVIEALKAQDAVGATQAITQLGAAVQQPA
jgi:hypothetical protein